MAFILRPRSEYFRGYGLFWAQKLGTLFGQKVDPKVVPKVIPKVVPKVVTKK